VILVARLFVERTALVERNMLVVWIVGGLVGVEKLKEKNVVLKLAQ
jgi:hypothetical protein